LERVDSVDLAGGLDQSAVFCFGHCRRPSTWRDSPVFLIVCQRPVFTGRFMVDGIPSPKRPRTRRWTQQSPVGVCLRIHRFLAGLCESPLALC
jgi:hypothetical protein